MPYTWVLRPVGYLEVHRTWPEQSKYPNIESIHVNRNLHAERASLSLLQGGEKEPPPKREYLYMVSALGIISVVWGTPELGGPRSYTCRLITLEQRAGLRWAAPVLK